MLVCSMSGTTAFALQTTTAKTHSEAQTTAAHNESSTSTSGTTMSAKEAEKKLKQQQAELEKNLEKTDAKLKELEKSSKVTEEYIDTLDQKIGYINEQLTLLENKNQKTQIAPFFPFLSPLVYTTLCCTLYSGTATPLSLSSSLLRPSSVSRRPLPCR